MFWFRLSFLAILVLIASSVGFIFFSIKPRDWLGRPCPQWP